MRWKRDDYVRKRVDIVCPVCEQYLTMNITLKHKKGSEIK